MSNYDPGAQYFRQLDQSMSTEIDAHDESLKRWIEAGCCVKCRAHHVIELNPKNITFRCSANCGWSAIYPIAKIGDSSPAWQCECFHWNGISVPRCNNCGTPKPGPVDPLTQLQHESEETNLRVIEHYEFPLRHPELRSLREVQAEREGQEVAA